LGNVALVDNWRVRATHRREFLDYYIANVAEVVSSMPGYVSGRVLATQNDAPYSWQVQAFYEFTSSDVVNSFKTEYDRALRKVKSGMTMEKVLDAMDPWVLAHEDGVLETVWQ
jgi:antibiotic biosynthesis monooxygenase (ABM) superfamily enzyme